MFFSRFNDSEKNMEYEEKKGFRVHKKVNFANNVAKMSIFRWLGCHGSHMSENGGELSEEWIKGFQDY